jgi:hypothetical protein
MNTIIQIIGIVGGIKMIDLYVALIIHDVRPFSKVPERCKDAVRAELLALGLDENGKPIE